LGKVFDSIFKDSAPTEIGHLMGLNALKHHSGNYIVLALSLIVANLYDGKLKISTIRTSYRPVNAEDVYLLGNAATQFSGRSCF
jgi:hypothetical protein